MSDYLSSDVLAIIFTRLSVKNTIQCTLVCKSWRTLIKSADFIKTHLNSWKHDDLFLIRPHHIGISNEAYALHLDDKYLTKYVNVDAPFHPTNNQYSRIIGSYDGVVCLTYDSSLNNKTVLWNPSVRKSFRLPQPQISFRNGPFDVVTGFGYDPNPDDYKVVKIYSRKGRVPAEVNVFSLCSWTWQNVTVEPQIQFRISPQASQACFNGSVHWIVSDIKAKRNFIMSYILGNEVFHTMELPGRVPYFPYFFSESLVKPAVIKGYLALVESDVTEYRIWSMREYGVSSSWVKIVDVKVDRVIDRWLGIKKSGELLLERKEIIYSYDPVKARQRRRASMRLGIHSRVGRNLYALAECLLHIEPYRESLVLLDRQANGDENEPEIIEEEEEEELCDDDDDDYGADNR